MLYFRRIQVILYICIIILITYNIHFYFLRVETFETKNNIPFIIYKTGPFEKELIPRDLHKQMEDMQALYNIKISYSSNQDMRNFIKYYNPYYLEYIDILKPGAYKADLWRLITLYENGGIYMDISMTFLIPPTKIIEESDELVLCNAHNNPSLYFYTGFMASYPKHPFIKACIDDVIRRIQNRDYGKDYFDITGPSVIKSIFKTFFGQDILSCGKHVINGHKVKIIKEDLENNQYFIYDANGTRIIKNRMESHYSVLYKDMSDHYSHKWKNRDVYAA